MQEGNNLHIRLILQEADPDPDPDQNRQGQYVDPVQFRRNSYQDALIKITNKITDELGWLKFSVYFQLTFSIVSGITVIVVQIQAGAVFTLLVFDILLCMVILGECIYALLVYRSLDKSIQFRMFILFLITTIPSFGLFVTIGICINWPPDLVVPLGWQTFFGLILAFGFYYMYKLMRDRDNIIMQLNAV